MDGPAGRHHHRERLRNHRVLRAPQDDHVRRGVHFHQLPCVRRRQRQQLAPRASRWRCGGAKQTALAPREGQALEERSSSSRSPSRPRTRGRQLPCVRRRQRQQLAPRASRWRRGGAKQIALAPREGQALEERSSSSRSARRPRTRGATHSCRAYDDDNGSGSRRARADGAAEAPSRSPRTSRRAGAKGGPGKVGGDLAHRARCGVQQPCVTTTTTAAARARQARRANGHTGQVLASARGSGPCRPRSEGGRAANCAAQRTNAVRHYDDSGVRRRHTTATVARARGARGCARGARGSSPRTRSCDGSSSARLLTEAASALAVRHSDDGSRACVIDDDGSCSSDAATWRGRTQEGDRHAAIDRSMSLIILSVIMSGGGCTYRSSLS